MFKIKLEKKRGVSEFIKKWEAYQRGRCFLVPGDMIVIKDFPGYYSIDYVSMEGDIKNERVCVNYIGDKLPSVVLNYLPDKCKYAKLSSATKE